MRLKYIPFGSGFVIVELSLKEVEKMVEVNKPGFLSSSLQLGGAETKEQPAIVVFDASTWDQLTKP